MTHDLVSSLSSYGFFQAAVTTLWLTFVAQLAGTVGGVLLAPLRMARHRAPRAIASAYLLLFRGTPELLQLIAWYAVVPLAGINLNLVEIAVVGLGANEAARMTEIIRAGFQAIDDSQRQAARVLGLTRTHTLVNVLLPQAARTVVAALGNEINIMFKTTSLVSVIGITELLRQSQLVAETARNPLGTYVAALIYYLALTTAWGVLQGLLARWAVLGRDRPRVLTAWWDALSGGLAGGRP